ncbi:MAG: CocE/NonD family hydrolase [Gemmatimonadetes bacterium]|nr:CocE/NonD family hydrolase [Gemmatimonadota bacterium]
MRTLPTVLLAALLASSCTVSERGPNSGDGTSGVPAELAAIYTKQEVMIPMRDGVKLFTSILVPKDLSAPRPILLRRTPYSCRPYGPDAFPGDMPLQMARYLRERYIVVCQDVRGRYMSEGDYVNVRPYLPVKDGPKDIDETTDTYDTVEWLIANLDADNGKVGISGISYPGFYTWMGTIDAHPAVAATSPQAPVSKWMAGDDFFHNGAFLLPHAYDFYSGFGWARPVPKSEPDTGLAKGTPDEYRFFLEMGPLSNANEKYLHHGVAFWDTLTMNGQWNDYWAARNILPHLKDLRPATLVVGGWFDTENLYGALNSYAANEAQSPGASNTLVMGPWYHGGWSSSWGDSLGAIAWGSRTSAFYTDSIEGPFFDHWLKGAPDPGLPEAYMFDTGAKAWRRFDAWPPKETKDVALYLQPEGALGFEPPAAGRREYDEYVHDPSNPVPYTSAIVEWYDPAFMLEAQRFASRRPDVLDYSTPVLEEDVTVAGPIRVSFTVSTSGTDADWVVKLVDVFPDSTSGGDPIPLSGYQMLVRGDVLRGKFRNGTDKPEAFRPGAPTPITFTLNDAFHTFRKGHRIMVQVQSSWFPMVDLNPGKFMDIFQAKDTDFQATTQRVYRSAARPSSITVKRLGP